MPPLSAHLSSFPGIAPRFLSKLKQLDIHTVKDLLWHFPTRYEDYSEITTIHNLIPHQETTIQGTIISIDSRRAWRHRGLSITEAVIEDETGTIRAVWFNQSYLAKNLAIGTHANFSGKVTEKNGEIYFSNPTYEILRDHYIHHETTHTARIVGIYPETRGLTSKGIRYLIKPILESLETLPDPIPQEILHIHHFPNQLEALRAIHFPNNVDEATKAKKRFIFEDLFILQLYQLRERMKLAQEQSYSIPFNPEWMKAHIDTLPFSLTLSQKKSLLEIMKDMERAHPMNRFMQGDVGSGKTIVAALAALSVANTEHQAAFMAPTEILARQHFATFKKFFPEFEKGVALLTGNESIVYYGRGLESTIPKTQLKQEVEKDHVAILFGTHALIEKTVVFPHLALVVIDEQHRFGVRQRKKLLSDPNKECSPELSENNQHEKIIEKELSYKLNKIFFDIQQEIGRFCREKQYSDLLEQKLKENILSYKREYPIEIGGVKSNFADFIVEEKIIIEVKAKPFITKEDYYQILRYLEVANIELGLLVNFQQKFLKAKRVLNSKFKPFGSFGYPPSGRHIPHFLSMSATPIPRTLSLTLFGDLDLSLITELPKDRKQIITKAVAPHDRVKTYTFIREEIKKGRQAFVICPRIEIANTHESDTNHTNTKNISDIRDSFDPIRDVKAVKEEYEKLSKKIFPDLKIAMLHGKMIAKEKEKIMFLFAHKKIDILVATSVVEVGVDIPNATVMMIEGADRFGLAQLYQFRGRVGRGEHQSYCFLFTDAPYITTRKRLESIVKAKNGFELAEYDLKLRGPGEFLGNAQTGMPDLAMKAIHNPELVRHARDIAEQVLENDPTLKTHPLLQSRLEEFQNQIHWE